MVPKLNETWELLKKYNQGGFHLLHGEIVSGIIGYFARQFEPKKEEYWSVVGRLHDIDFELYPEEHCAKCSELLREQDVLHNLILRKG